MYLQEVSPTVAVLSFVFGFVLYFTHTGTGRYEIGGKKLLISELTFYSLAATPRR